MVHEKLNKVTGYVKNASTYAAKKSTYLLDLSRLIVERKNLEGRLKEIYIKLGEAFYKNNSGKNIVDNHYTECFDSIGELHKKIEHLNKKILKIKDMKLCKYCNNEIPKNSVFCSVCGKKL
jgi:hypothetical protein